MKTRTHALSATVGATLLLVALGTSAQQMGGQAGVAGSAGAVSGGGLTSGFGPATTGNGGVSAGGLTSGFGPATAGNGGVSPGGLTSGSGPAMTGSPVSPGGLTSDSGPTGAVNNAGLVNPSATTFINPVTGVTTTSIPYGSVSSSVVTPSGSISGTVDGQATAQSSLMAPGIQTTTSGDAAVSGSFSASINGTSGNVNGNVSATSGNTGGLSAAPMTPTFTATMPNGSGTAGTTGTSTTR